MALDQVMRAQAQEVNTQAPIYAAKVTRVTSPTEIFVMAPTYSDFEYGPVKLAGPQNPTVGDECLLQFDSDNNPWIHKRAAAAVNTTVPAGGITGQILAKNSNADGDTEWITSAAGGGTVTLDPWHNVGDAGEPAFQNGWINTVTVGYGKLRFRKDPEGRVWVQGVITTGTGVAFTLPVGYRPVRSQFFVILQDGGVAGTYLNVATDGTVTPTRTQTTAYIDCSFDTESVTSIINTQAIAMDAWHSVGSGGEPAFQNSWGNLGGEAPVQFKKDPFGNVKFRGTLTGVTSGTVAFTLPVGYRPPTGRVRNVSINNQGASGWAQVNVGTDGTVTAWFDTLGGIYVSLDQVEFDTDTVSNYVVGAVPTPPETPRYIGAAGQPAFVNSWVHYDNTSATPGLAGQRDVRFWRHQGHVYLAGLCKNGTVGSIAFTLPVGYRPDVITGGNQLIIPIVSNAAYGAILIYANGDVVCWQGSNFYFAFDGVVFKHA